MVERPVKSCTMFPRSAQPNGQLTNNKGSVSQIPASMRFHHQPTQRTHVNNSIGPESLPVYDWKPTSTHVLPTGPPNANSRKRQNSGYNPYSLVKRQIFESSFQSEERCPSQPSLHPGQPIAGTSQSTFHVSDISYPRPLPCPLDESSHSLQSYAKDKVSAQMVELFEACKQQSSDLHRKEVCRTQLQKDIRHLYSNARLYLTGSSMSGLGCRSSDADLCLVVKVKKRCSPIEVLSTLQKLFKSLSYVDRTQLIKAKVPILRFKERGSNLEFDLNINNTVGIRNTFLLRSYTYADIRIRPIMLVIKKWARHAEINDASKGTLSSYTLALMVLHYLQVLKDPIVPSLQKDHPGSFDPSMDLDMVPGASQQVPRFISRNKSSLGELFLGFLKYYASNFRWDSQVISVREARALPKNSSPQWRNKFICVEEPFERSNVARAVHEKFKFETIKAKFAESYWNLQQKNDLNSLLPIRVIINKEQSGR